MEITGPGAAGGRGVSDKELFHSKQKVKTSISIPYYRLQTPDIVAIKDIFITDKQMIGMLVPAVRACALEGDIIIQIIAACHRGRAHRISAHIA